MKRQIWHAVAGLVIAVLVFQLLLRYQYVHLRGNHVLRIDRLTATTCIMPCLETPPQFGHNIWQGRERGDAQDRFIVGGRCRLGV
jgi:hypothetical protein